MTGQPDPNPFDPELEAASEEEEEREPDIVDVIASLKAMVEKLDLDLEEQGAARPDAGVMHWMERVAQRAGLGGERPVLSPAAEAKDVWEAVAGACGIEDETFSKLVAEYFRLDVARFEDADPNAVLLVGESMARNHHFFPLYETDRQIVIATCDPTDVETERAVGFSTGRTVVFQVASPGMIQEQLDQRFSPERTVETLLGTLEGEDLPDDAVRLVEEMGPESISSEDASATPVVKLTNLILRDGIAQKASDIHIEPGRTHGLIRYRVDGELRKHMDLPMSALNRIISRIKILSRLDIADRLRPQDGKARVRIGDFAYDLRVSTIPAGGAEKCVIRILDSNSQITLEDLDLPKYELARFRQLIGYRDGIVVVTGPTGSGKTTTLYGALREMADGKINIMTVENPIEYELPDITQTQVESKQGVTFARALRAILRQDPDVILVGEIRDSETAETAAQAAMTGHLVLATIHANDAVSAVARLADLGLQYSTIAATLRGAVAQRLMRRVCAACAEPVRGVLTPEEEKLAEKNGIEPVLRAVGCAECGFTGYKGRIPVDEVLISGPRFHSAVQARKGWPTLSRIAQQGGMRTMHQVALDWVTQGKTTLAEVDRALGSQFVDDAEATEEAGPPSILVVDDEDEARLLHRTLLAQEGFRVTEARDGHEALEALRQKSDFSLVILDLAMPEMDGREILARIRGMRETAAIPVLISTGTGDEHTETELLEAGADEYMEKSATAARFLARVRAVLRRSMM
jgi:type II secretory ATPase GspE/PulE/Tfp pilus assembly ATPase PilB-like protein/ActR/RegA family two-component response regulator